MPQAPSKPSPTKAVIDASVPGSHNSPIKNISDADKKKIIDGWDKQAAKRAADVARESATPEKPTKVLKFELHQYGRYWQAFVIEDGKPHKGQPVKLSTPLLGSPSLLSSALDALEDAMLQRANRA